MFLRDPVSASRVEQHRLAGFRDTLRAAGRDVPDDAIVTADFTRDGGYAGMLELNQRHPGLTAVFALNDPTAVGAISALREEIGKSVPQDVSVIGFDDIPTAQDVTPALTTVRLPLEEMGERAMRLLLEPSDRGPRTIRIKADLVVRQSTTSVT